MSGFIEVTSCKNGVPERKRLLNINHIVEVVDNIIFTDNTVHFQLDFDYIECKESYEEIKRKIAYATKE